jgi:hypothetical protein
MRWKQSLNEETGKYEFIPVDQSAMARDSGAAIHGVIQSFVSSVDGSVISDRKQLREHNIRNNVVNTAEFDGHWDGQEKVRDRHYTGENTREESFKRKQSIYNIIQRAEDHGR